MKKKLILVAGACISIAALAQINTFGYNFSPADGLHGNGAIASSTSVARNSSAFWQPGAMSEMSYGFGNGLVVYGNGQYGRSFATTTETIVPDGVPAGTSLSVNNPIVNTAQLGAGMEYTFANKLQLGLEMDYLNLANDPSDAIANNVPTPGGVVPEIPTSLAFKAVGYRINPYMQYKFGQSTIAANLDYRNLWFGKTLTGPVSSMSGKEANHAIMTKLSPEYSYNLGHGVSVGTQASAQIVNSQYINLEGIYQQGTSNSSISANENKLDTLTLKPGINYTPKSLKGALTLSLFGGMDWFNYRTCNQVAGSMEYSNYLVLTPQVSLSLPIAQNFYANMTLSMNAYNGVTGNTNAAFDKSMHYDGNAMFALGYYF